MIGFVTLLAAALTTPPVQIRVEGEGYLRFVRDGRTVYAREATIKVDKGILVGKDNLSFMPRVQVLGNPESIKFESDGRIIGFYQGSERMLGKIVIATFGEDVRPVEDKGWLVSSARATTGQPGSQGFGTIVSGDTSPQRFSKSPTVRLKSIAEIRADVFTLGDIAEIDAPQSEKEKIAALQIASTPALGVEYKMTQEMIKGRLKKFGTFAEGIDFVGESTVTVMRKGQRVSHQQFVDKALSEASSRKVSASTSANSLSQQDMVVPEGELLLSVSSFEQNGSRFNVRVDVLVDGKKFNSRLITIESSIVNADFKVGQSVKLLVRSSGAVVETTGKVKAFDKSTGLVTVQAATGATMTGKAINGTTVEVTL